MNKTLLSLILVALIAAPLTAFGNVATVFAASTNTAIRGQSQQTVYWYANDGKRYVFPNAATYFTWFPSFDNVQNISDSELFAIPLAGNVTYRPGAKLVKVTTDPKVYAVARGGVLRHVTSEYLATQFFGSNWASKVQDVPDEFFVNYTVGSPIYNTSDYNVSNEYNGVFNPNDSLRTQGQNNNGQSGSLTLTSDRTSITSGQAVYLTSDYNANLTSGGRIEIKEVRTNTIVKTCYNSSSCNVTVYPYQSGYSSTQYVSTVFNNSGSQITTQYSPTIYFDGSNGQTGTLTLNADRTSITSGQAVMLSANYNNSLNGGRIDIKEVRNNTIVKTCYNTTYCTVTVYPYQTGYSSTQYFAEVTLGSVNQLNAIQYSPVIYFNGTSNNQIGSLSLNSDRTTVTSGQTITLNANYTGSFPSGGRLVINQSGQGSNPLATTLKTCYTNSCSHTTTLWSYTNGMTYPFVAIVYDASGNMIVWSSPVTVSTNDSTGSTSNDGVNFINGLTLQSDRTSAANGDMVKLTANAYNNGNWSYVGNRIEIRDVRTGSIVKTCYDQSWCVVDVSVQGNNGTAQYETRIYDRNGNFVMSQFGPVIYVSGTTSNTGSSNQSITLNLQSDRTSITSGQTVTLSLTVNRTGLASYEYITIKDLNSGAIVKTCSYMEGNCYVTVYPIQESGRTQVQYQANAYSGVGYCSAIDCRWITSANSPVISFNGTGTTGTGTVSQSVTVPTSYLNMIPSGGRVVIKRANNIVTTCYRNSSCTIPVSQYQYYHTNETKFMVTVYGANGEIQNEFSVPVFFDEITTNAIRYTAYIYDRNGQYVTSHSGSTTSVNSTGSTGTGSVGSVAQIPNTDIYIAPTYNVRAGNTVYLTASFTNLPYTSTQTIIRLYTEGSTTAIGTCSGSVSCSVPYTISNSGVNTRVYGVASNSSLGNTIETARIPLATF